MNNMERCLDYVTSHYSEIATKELLEKTLMIMSSECRKVFSARWGLDSGDYCRTFKKLDEKLGMQNSKEIYIKSLKELEELVWRYKIIPNLKWIEFELGEADLVSAYAYLFNAIGEDIKSIFKKEHVPFKEVKKLCDEKISCLKEKPKKLIIYWFGLEDGKIKSYDEIKNYVDYDGVVTVRNVAIKRLRTSFLNDIVFSKFPEGKEVLNLSFSTYQYLVKSGICSIETFKELTEDDLREIRYSHMVKEIITKQKELKQK